jgi:hypothetical protein
MHPQLLPTQQQVWCEHCSNCSVFGISERLFGCCMYIHKFASTPSLQYFCPFHLRPLPTTLSAN